MLVGVDYPGASALTIPKSKHQLTCFVFQLQWQNALTAHTHASLTFRGMGQSRILYFA